MEALSSPRYIADLLGVSEGKIRWDRPFAFFTALCISGFVTDVSLNALQWPGISRDVLLSLLLRSALDMVLLTVCACALFRWIRNQYGAAALAAMAAGLLNMLPWLIFGNPLQDPVRILFYFAWPFLFLMGLVLFVPRVRTQWLGLALGAAVATVVASTVGSIVLKLQNVQVSFETHGQLVLGVTNLAFGLLFATIFAPGAKSSQARTSLPLSRMVGLLAWFMGLATVGATLVGVQSFKAEDAPRWLLLATGISTIVLAIAAAAVMLVLFYRMWAAIQDGQARTTPGKAIGLLFVPLFNIFWAFQVLPGFATDYNRYAARHSLRVPRMSRALFLLYLAVVVCQWIPGIQPAMFVATLLVMLLMARGVCNAVGALEDARAGVAPAAAAGVAEAAADRAAAPAAARINKLLYMSVIAFGWIAGGGVLSLWSEDLKKRASDIPEELALLAALAALASSVMFIVLFYKSWAAIQDGKARTTPGKALGFLFIPIFQLYWIFQVFPGLATDYNRYAERYRLAVPRLSRGLLLTYVILCFTTWIPLVGIPLTVMALAIGLSMISEICDGVNALPASVGAPPPVGVIEVRVGRAAAAK
jgi:hypothetical protein